MEDKIIERTTLSFIEQLQNQIQLCREAFSNPKIHLSSRVDTLEALLWAKLRDDKEYQEVIKELNKWFKIRTKNLKRSDYLTDDERRCISYKRQIAKKKFKEIMIFIDKKDLMPIGEE